MALMWTSTLHTADTEAPEFGEGKSAKKFSAFGRSVVRSAVFLRADRFAAVSAAERSPQSYNRYYSLCRKS